MKLDYTINSRESIINFLQSNGAGSALTVPISQCDFDLVVEVNPNLFWLNDDNAAGAAGEFIKPSEIVTNFDFPQTGISWSQDSSLFYLPNPSINVGTFSVNFFAKPDIHTSINPISSFHRIYNNQFTPSGSLRMLSYNQRPRFTIRILTVEAAIPVILFRGCSLSNIIPAISMSSADFSAFTFNVSYITCTFLV